MSRTTKTYPAIRDPNRQPTHPGEILREDIFPTFKISVSEAARQLRITRQTLHKILAGTMSITPDMAVRLGKFCGNGPNLWINMQVAHDLWEAKRRLRHEMKFITAHPPQQTGSSAYA